MLPGHRNLLARSVLLPAIAIAIAGPLHAGTLHVPSEQPTIQMAILAANPGDTILVAPGTYVETIDLLGKGLVVQSEGGAAVTTIDAAGGGTVVTLDGAEPYGTVLRGFTITGAATGKRLVVGGTSLLAGGGVYVGHDAHLELRECVITGNTVTDPTLLTYGAGLAVDHGTVALRDCALSHNTAKRGAALSNLDFASSFSVSSHIALNGCTVTENTATGSAPSAVALYSCRFTATDCLVTDNIGAGVAIQGPVIVTGCVFSGNSTWGCTMFGDGGSDLYDCAFLGNGSGGAKVSGSGFQSEHYVKRCVFAAGDTYSASGGSVSVSSCTFDGAHVQMTSYGATVIDSIARNTGGLVQGTPTSVQVSWSDVEGGAVGDGNIDVDPLWVNAAAHDYHLSASSPCIDAGNPAGALEADLSIADMGALPFSQWDDLGGGIASSTSNFTFPRLVGQGLLVGGETVGLALENAPALKSTYLFLGVSELGLSFKGGILWPSLTLVFPGVVTDGTGHIALATTWPGGVPSGVSLWAQFWFKSTTAQLGFAASNAVRGTVP